MNDQNGRQFPNVHLLSRFLLAFAERARPSAHLLGFSIQVETFLERCLIDVFDELMDVLVRYMWNLP